MHRIIARRAHDASEPCVDRDPAIVASFLMTRRCNGGFAAGVAFPTEQADVASLVRNADRVARRCAVVTTGGATARQLGASTRALSTTETPPRDHMIRVGAGRRRHSGRHATHLALYPPVPTFEGAFVGGTISTNAAGAAT
jgi:FAD/FMN-containing dehydrogenase